jgi:hypothetical protein
MLISTRILLSLVLLAGGLAGVGSLPANLLRAVGWQIRPPRPPRTQEPAPDESVVVIARMKAKERILLGMLAGERGLFETAAWFRDLNEAPAEHPDENWWRQPGRSDGEKVCRQVIAWALAYLQQSQPPSQVEGRIRQLEEELQEHIARHGKVVLP